MSRFSLRALLQDQGDPALGELMQRWCPSQPPKGRDAALAACAAAMEDRACVLRRLQELPRKLQDLLELFLADPGAPRAVPTLFADHGRSYKSRFDLEASLAALHREGFLFPARDKRWANFDHAGYAVPGELADTVLGHRRRSQSALKDQITLQGFLDARHFRRRGAEKNGKAGDSKADAGKAADHARKIYKLYLMEESIAGRLRALPASVRAVVDVALLRHGGLLSQAELLRELDSDDVPDLDLIRKCLEEAMLGTAGALDLARFGIQPEPAAVVLFHEVALYGLRHHADTHPITVAEELSCGPDQTTNIGRFLRELQSSRVQFTAEGELFKASQKRIAGLLLPVPGALLSSDAQLDWVYRFCLQRRLIDRRGERALRPTPAGLEFERAPLQEQVKQLLAAAVEERAMPGEPFHQARLRRVFLRLLRRAEVDRWQEIQLLPFLARNAYLAQLDAQQTEDFFAARFQGGGYTPTESLQQMAWNLLLWVKRRLFPLGIVDLGLSSGRPTALRLSRLGAELLEAEPAGRAGGARSSVIVNPDFEVLVFPGDDVHEAVHSIDRFAKRTKSDHVHQFKLSQASVRAGIDDGMTLAQMVAELQDRARAPIPQNVLYTLEEWAGRAVK
jgi:hypothetical protein